MIELDFVFLGADVSLRRVVDATQTTLRAQGKEWYTYHVLVRMDDAYRCIRLTQLSAELEGSDWSMDTSLIDYTLSPCAAAPADRVSDDALRRVRQPFVVAEKGGAPVALYQGQAARGAVRTDRRGWWRLVGRRMAELGRVPEWPRSLPKEFQCENVVSIEPRTTLSELAERLSGLPRGDEATLVIPDAESGRWVVFQAQDLLDQITREYPDAGPGSMVGALVDLSPSEMASLERSETPWELIEELFSGTGASLARYLIVERGRPVGILSQRRVMRRGFAREGAREGAATGWTRFVEMSQGLEPGEREQGRVVNAWFADEQEKTISHTHALAANRVYRLGVNVGNPSEKAHVVGEQPALDARLVNYLIGEGRPLTLRVDSQDCVILDREQEIGLPAAGTTEDVYFRVVTPVRTGVSSLRLGVYFENNLVQSYLVYARVAPNEGPMPEGTGDGWWSECEYTLSSNFSNLQDLKSRRVCVWIGEGRGEMRRAGISESTGMDMGPTLTVNEGLIQAALAHYRELLYKSCVRESGPDQVEYLYGADHSPIDPQTFEENVAALAELGQMLYERVFGTENGSRVAQRLRDVERTQGGPLVVQIARLSLDATFPWAVLYDRPLYYHPKRNVVCQQFLGDEDCTDHCPHAEDPNVICPYGFWGFRYVLEQPLRPPHSYTSVATRLRAADRPRLALVYGTGLGMTAHHRQQLEAIVNVQADAVVHSATSELLEEMRAGPAVVYFYCHGGNTPYRQWLVVRDDDPLMSVHLGDDLRSAWADAAPLVVLNGCHTGKYDPSTLLSFVHRFGALGAAGVVGTEIPIHEYLGNAFGQFLFSRLLSGEPVGKIVYDFRRELLKKRNLLGLVYVPYCYADLRIARSEA